MIKLSKTIYDNFVDKDGNDYVSSCLKKFAEKEVVFLDKEVFGGRVSREELIYTNNKYDRVKIEKILLFNFEDLSKNTEVLNNYFKTGLLIAKSDFSINDELKKNNMELTMKNRVLFRKNFVKEYSNQWIDDYFSDASVYRSSKRFNDVIKEIKQEFIGLTLIDNDKHIIDYGMISDIRDALLESTGISVCPYCNRQFISSFDDNNKKRTTATLDHFYPKSAFPLFALSLYNFVPACYSCNSILKTTSTKGIMYPFSKGYEDHAHFKMKNFKDLDTLLGNNNDLEIYVDYEKENNEDITNSLELFKTEEIYQHHSNHVQSILLKSTIYSDKYKEMLKNDLRSKGLDYSIEGLNAFIYNLDLHDTEQKNVILGRLTKDILKQIDEWKNKP